MKDMKHKFTILITLLLGLAFGFYLRGVLDARSRRTQFMKSLKFITSQEGAEFFNVLSKQGVSRENVIVTPSGSGIEIKVKVEDSSVDKTVKAFKDVAPSLPILLTVESERGPVLILPNGTLDFRDEFDRLKQEQEKTPQKSIEQNETKNFSKP